MYSRVLNQGRRGRKEGSRRRVINGDVDTRGILLGGMQTAERMIFFIHHCGNLKSAGSSDPLDGYIVS